MFQTIHTVVFQAEKDGGNPCPVTLNADDLTTEQMQQMTKGFGKESVFLMKPTLPECDIKARYFVPLHEMEMCIHATIGSTTVLVEKGICLTSPVIFETAFGPINVKWERKNNRIDVSVEQFIPQYLEDNPTPEEICRALQISPADLDEGPIQSVATSRFKLIIPLKKRSALDALSPDFEYLWSLCDRYNTTGFYPYVMELDNNGEPVFFARQFPKRAGYNEDPATGVAASALGAYLTKYHIVQVQEGWNCCTIMQGFAMERPSIIYSDVLVKNNEIIKTQIRGNAYLLGGGDL